jgi:hypothetical protein
MPAVESPSPSIIGSWELRRTDPKIEVDEIYAAFSRNGVLTWTASARTGGRVFQEPYSINDNRIVSKIFDNTFGGSKVTFEFEGTQLVLRQGPLTLWFVRD